jgi:hypothetical protein
MGGIVTGGGILPAAAVVEEVAVGTIVGVAIGVEAVMRVSGEGAGAVSATGEIVVGTIGGAKMGGEYASKPGTVSVFCRESVIYVGAMVGVRISAGPGTYAVEIGGVVANGVGAGMVVPKKTSTIPVLVVVVVGTVVEEEVSIVGVGVTVLVFSCGMLSVVSTVGGTGDNVCNGGLGFSDVPVPVTVLSVVSVPAKAPVCGEVVVVPTELNSIPLINERSRLSVALKCMVPIATPARSTWISPWMFIIPQWTDAQSVPVQYSGCTETECTTIVGTGASRLTVPSTCTFPARIPPESTFKSPCACKSPSCMPIFVARMWMPAWILLSIVGMVAESMARYCFSSGWIA